MNLLKTCCLSLIFAASASAKPDESNEDYAPTVIPKSAEATAPLTIDPKEINVVAGNLGRYGSDFTNNFANYMNLWMAAKGAGPRQIEWTLKVPEDGKYEIDALVKGRGSRLVVSCNGKRQNAEVEGDSWERLSLGALELKAGENTLKLEIMATERFFFDALELTQPEVKAALLKDAQAMRVQPDWFKDAGYGLMFQWTNRATPPEGPIKPWEEKVNDFKLDDFVDMVESTGAAYVLWSVTWGEQYISAPLKSLDAIIAGRTTKRDLLGEMADALEKRGIKLIFYYHYGYDCNHSIDKDWMEASGGYKADKTELYKNWMAIISEIGERYGDKLHGWWFDGGQRYYNCHFDNTPADQGPLSVPFKELTLAAKSGNPDRVVAYNSWVKPRLTEYQDYFGGEGVHAASGLEDGTFQNGPQEGLLAHGCFTFERKWGHIEPNSIIAKPKFNLKKPTAMIQKAQKQKFPLSINLEMYEDGSVSPDSVTLLEQLREDIRGK
ncbi:alpha-L-fucosidase [Luteolibacter sp. AS25]|uniref:alpha-L-fucosidase n=1 Tax=Luteolibacter sp. AS25 TaxID=3135776 RepID=UPI00398ABCFF